MKKTIFLVPLVVNKSRFQQPASIYSGEREKEALDIYVVVISKGAVNLKTSDNFEVVLNHVAVCDHQNRVWGISLPGQIICSKELGLRRVVLRQS